MKKKLTGIVALTAGTVLTLAACSGDSNGSGNETNGDAADVTLGFFTDKAAWEDSFTAVNEAGEGVAPQLNFTGYSDPVAYDAFIKQSFRTNNKPDLFTWHTGGQLEELVADGLVAETTDIWQEAIANGDVAEDLADNYTFDGKQYCVPLNVVYWVMYYNKGVFADNGLDVPTTWDDFMNVGHTLVANGVTPLHQMNIIFEFVWFQALLAGLDPDAYNGLSTGEVNYTDPPVVEAMELWHEMQSEGFFIDPGVTTDPQTLLQTGEVAMAYFGTFFTGQLASLDMESDEDYGMFVLPAVSDSVGDLVVAETGPLCVATDSANEQAALEYSAWWMGQDAQTAWNQARGDISFNPKATVTDSALGSLVDEVSSDSFTQLPRYLEATPTAIYAVASEQFGAFVTNNDDPMGVLEAIQAEADKYWANN